MSINHIAGPGAGVPARSTYRSRRLIGATVAVVAVEILLSAVVYLWDMRSGLDAPSEWESDEWLSLVGTLWLAPMIVLLAITLRVFNRTRDEANDMRQQISLRERTEHERAERMATERSAELDILDRHAIVPHFQPIVRLDGTAQVVGYEALARFPTGNPESWFRTAADVGLTVELEMEALARALECAAQLPPDAYLSLNASPVTIDAPEFFALFRDADAERIVIEITETLVVTDYERTNRILQTLRKLGARIAVDDAGAGFASLQHIVNLGPDIIKLDRSLIRRIDTHPARRAMARAIAAFAAETGASLVAEGVEESREMVVLRDLGVSCAQGYLFGRPAPVAQTARSVESPAAG